MKIEKVTGGTIPPKSQILNSHSESKQDTYSCDYINNQIEHFELPLESGYSVYQEGTTNKGYYNKITHQVTLNLWFTGTFGSGAWHAVASVPEKYRPPVNTYFEAAASGGNRVMVQLDDKVRTYSADNITQLRCCITYYTD